MCLNSTKKKQIKDINIFALSVTYALYFELSNICAYKNTHKN